MLNCSQWTAFSHVCSSGPGGTGQCGGWGRWRRLWTCLPCMQTTQGPVSQGGRRWWMIWLTAQSTSNTLQILKNSMKVQQNWRVTHPYLYVLTQYQDKTTLWPVNHSDSYVLIHYQGTAIFWPVTHSDSYVLNTVSRLFCSCSRLA